MRAVPWHFSRGLCFPQIQPAQAVNLQEPEQLWLCSGAQGAGSELEIGLGAAQIQGEQRELYRGAALDDPEPQEAKIIQSFFTSSSCRTVEMKPLTFLFSFSLKWL